MTGRLSRKLVFVRREWRFLLFGLLLTFWSGPGQTFVFSLFSAEIRGDFSLSHGDFGGIYTLATLASAAVLWKAGQLVDRFALIQFVPWLVALLAAMTALFSFVAGPLSLFFGIFAVRFLGQGMMTHTAMTAMARRYEKQRGRAIAVAGLGFPIGEALFPITIIAALGIYAWQDIWVVLGALIAVTLLPLLPWLLKPSPGQDGYGAITSATGDPEPRHWSRAEMFRDRRFYLLIPLVTAQSAIVTGIFFHQVHFVSLKGWEMSWWAFCFIAYALMQVGGSFLSGTLVDKFSARKLAPFMLLPLVLALIFFAFLSQSAGAIVILGMLGLGAGAGNPIISSLWAEMYGTRHLGSIRAVGSVLMVFGSALGPVIMGWTLDGGGSLELICFFSALVALAAAGCSRYGANQPLEGRLVP